MADAEEEQRVGKLAVHPQILIKGQEAYLGSDPAHNGSADGEQDEHAVDAENQTSTSRDPHRVFQCVKTCQSYIGSLFIPSICENAKMKSPEENVVEELLDSELLADQFAVCELASHLG